MEEKKEKIINLINDSAYVPMQPKELEFFMEVPQNESQLFNELISQLISEGKIITTKKGKLITPTSKGLIAGLFESTAKGFGFIRCDDGSDDIFIPANSVGGATHKDRVFCRVTFTAKNSKKREGEIVKILEKGKVLIVGTFEESRSFGFVTPDNQRFTKDIFIPKSKKMSAVTGSKVLVRITKDATEESKPEGEVVNVIGHINDPGVDILSIVYDMELPLTFPDEVLNEVEKISDEVSEDEIKGRKDLRNYLMVTIDGEDAKDLDDAISISKLNNGHYSLGVHIADVTNYVKEGSAIDKEALLRGTSCYLVDRVIPMLPHKLSNGICSLNANVERLALTCLMEIDNKGKLISSEICESIINIDKRLSYTIVNSLLVEEESPYAEEYKDFVEMFATMKELRDILLKKRVTRGAIEFDFPESKIILDKNSKPIDIVARQRNVATSIIEEFMLMANETIAEEYFWLELPFVFRSHNEPDEAKIEKLKEFIGYFGYFLKGQSAHPKSLQKLLSTIEATDEEAIISKIVLRSMMQARYTSDNQGHFGLAAKYYCHFTSPIRRYPDLQIHRIIKENINGKLKDERVKHYYSFIDEVCNSCSTNERRAEEAERETNKLKKCEYMADKIGESFSGVISGVTSWGIFVELKNTVEGMISVTSMDDDNYVYDEDHLQYTGTYKSYRIGQSVNIKVDKVDVPNRKIDFLFDEE